MPDINTIITNLLLGFNQIGASFVKDLSILWFIAPIIIFWVILEIYFDRYKKEELGWNTALGNGLSVFWVSVICLRYLFSENFQNFNWTKLITIAVIFLYGAGIVANSFSHKLKKKISFLIAAPTPVYFLSLFAILWTYDLLPLTLWVIIDLVILYILISLFELLLKKIIRPAKTEEPTPEEPSLEEPSLEETPLEMPKTEEIPPAGKI